MLSDIIKKFDEKFDFLYCMDNVEKDIKDFLFQEIKTALESVVVEEIEYKNPKFIYDYDACRDEVIKKKEEFLNN